MPERVLIMAGGTGGHIYPALAVADALRAHGVEPVWLGSRRGMETRLVPAAGYRLYTVLIEGLRGRGLLRQLLAPLAIALAVLQAIVLMRRLRPAVVLGMGGFASGPGGIAAWLTRRPLLIHEQNAIAGLTNRILARCARVVLVAFPGTLASRAPRVTGNPVRAAIAALPAPEARGLAGADPLRVLVVGGSRGARALNETVPGAIAALRMPLRIRHQTGSAEDQAAVEQAYRQAGVPAQVLRYIDDMPAVYADTDLVIARAGAMTIAELACAGLPSVLIPYPHAVDDHQTANARYLVGQHAAVLLPQAQLSVARLAGVLGELLRDRARLLAMATAARALARPQATAQVAQACLELLHD